MWQVLGACATTFLPKVVTTNNICIDEELTIGILLETWCHHDAEHDMYSAALTTCIYVYFYAQPQKPS